VKRPLFERRRRPVEPLPSRSEPVTPAPVVQRSEPDQSALTLLGVMMGEGRTMALLRRNAGGQNVRVEEGDVIDGWTIKQIEAQRVVLSQGSRQVSLQLFRKQAR
jgi:type IV pilus biogenesis protein PilP